MRETQPVSSDRYAQARGAVKPRIRSAYRERQLTRRYFWRRVDRIKAEKRPSISPRRNFR